MDRIERIKTACPSLPLREDVSLSEYTTLRVGGEAALFAEPKTEGEIVALLCAAKEAGVPVLVLGNGSNTLVRDGGFPGIVLHLGRDFGEISCDGNVLTAQAGALLSTLAKTACENGLTGLEFAHGIPGSVGGGVYMNAGAYGGELSQTIQSVRVWDGERIRDVGGDEMDFSYRHTAAMEHDWLILSAVFTLSPGNKAEIESVMRDQNARRREKQPLEYPSAGSFFKRPAGHFAGQLIERSGLKGLRIGGAQVSEKHAGFLINRGNATAGDFLSLMKQVQRTVKRDSGVLLENEVRIVGRNRKKEEGV